MASNEISKIEYSDEFVAYKVTGYTNGKYWDRDDYSSGSWVYYSEEKSAYCMSEEEARAFAKEKEWGNVKIKKVFGRIKTRTTFEESEY